MKELCDTCHDFSSEKICVFQPDYAAKYNKWIHRTNGWCIKHRRPTSRNDSCGCYRPERNGYYNVTVKPIDIFNNH